MGKLSWEKLHASELDLLSSSYYKLPEQIKQPRFWQRAIKSATSTSQRHMIESFTAYLESVVQQAYDRDTNVFLTVDSYFEKRRENVGVRSSYVPLELNLSLPDHVFYHPTIQELSYLIADLVILDNVRPSTSYRDYTY